MNHTWQPLDKQTAKCKRCGCERIKSSNGVYVYARSGQAKVAGFDCIDWNVENSKTID